MKWFIAFVTAAMVYLGFATFQHVHAGGTDYNCFHCTINNYDGDLVEETYVTEEYYVEEKITYNITEGISERDLAEGMAALMSVATIDFSNTTKKLQLGIGAGGYDGTEALSVGIGKVIDFEDGSDVLLSFKATRANGHTPWGASAVWKF